MNITTYKIKGVYPHIRVKKSVVYAYDLIDVVEQLYSPVCHSYTEEEMEDFTQSLNDFGFVEIGDYLIERGE